jgi:hypothetical protein
MASKRILSVWTAKLWDIKHTKGELYTIAQLGTSLRNSDIIILHKGGWRKTDTDLIGKPYQGKVIRLLRNSGLYTRYAD